MTNFSKYIDFRSHLNKINAKYQLDPKEEQMLDFISAIIQAGKELKVGDLILEKQLGSLATIHARLSEMVQKGFIAKQYNQKRDSRAKYLTLGRRGKTRAKEISRLMAAI